MSSKEAFSTKKTLEMIRTKLLEQDEETMPKQIKPHKNKKEA